MPFRNENDLIHEGEIPSQALNRLLIDNSNLLSHHEKLQKKLQANWSVSEINNARYQADELNTQNATDNNLGPQSAGEVKDAMHDIQDLQNNITMQFSLDKLISMLNCDQSRVFKHVTEHLLHQQQHETRACKCSDLTPLHMFIGGVGGTGKSFLIQTITAKVADIWKNHTNGLTCAVTAPTGLAAFNISGVTVHRFFQLPIEHEGKTAQYWSLPRDSQKLLRATFQHLKLIIIDEVSMLSSLNLAYIHLRLCEVFGGDNWFGSMNILFDGDLLQLPPVNTAPVFEQLNSKAILTRLGCMTSVNIWKETIVYHELTINERQKTDPQFSQILYEVRCGLLSTQSTKTLQG